MIGRRIAVYDGGVLTVNRSLGMNFRADFLQKQGDANNDSAGFPKIFRSRCFHKRVARGLHALPFVEKIIIKIRPRGCPTCCHTRFSDAILWGNAARLCSGQLIASPEQRQKYANFDLQRDGVRY